MIPVSLPPALGNAHLVLLHLPVGFLGAALLLELWTWRDEAGRRLVEKLLAANAVAALVTATAGLMLAAQGDYPESSLGRHRWAGVACAVVAVLAWWLRARRGVGAGRVGLGALTLATVVARHQGAALTHGDGLFAWSRDEESVKPETSATRGTMAPAATGFEVHPLIEKHCVECHGPEKQKGRLRLDSLASARKGGRGGDPAIVPGDAEGGELMRRIALPRADEEAMPPGDRDALSAVEKSELAAWIAGLPIR